MARIVIIGGIESTFANAQVLHELGEEIIMFYTRGEDSPGWQGVDMVDESLFSFTDAIPKTCVKGNINDHVAEISDLNPDFIYSLGWQQIYSQELLAIAPFIGIHESLLPKGAGPTPIANAILHSEPETGCTLFWLDDGMDTGAIIGQLKNSHSPQTASSTQIYAEDFVLSKQLLQMYVPHINQKTAPAIPQNFEYRTEYNLVNWSDWDEELVLRARTYPYV